MSLYYAGLEILWLIEKLLLFSEKQLPLIKRAFRTLDVTYCTGASNSFKYHSVDFWHTNPPLIFTKVCKKCTHVFSAFVFQTLFISVFLYKLLAGLRKWNNNRKKYFQRQQQRPLWVQRKTFSLENLYRLVPTRLASLFFLCPVQD